MNRVISALLASFTLFAAATAESATFAYAVGNLRITPGAIATPDVLFRIDLDTGDSTAIGQVRAADGSKVYQYIGGMDFHPSTGILYAVDDVDDLLLTIDPATGIATEIGKLTASGVAIPSVALMALSFDPDGTLYFAASSGRRLSTLDTSTAVLTDIATGGAAPNVASLAISSAGAFYGISAVSPTSNTLLAIDPTDGSSAGVGTGLGFVSGRIGLDFDANGTLWGVEQGSGSVMSRIFTVDLVTGLGDVVGPMTVPATGYLVDDVESLAIAPVPLPAASWMLATALVPLLARARRRRRR
jgi:hypothetical protein